MVVNVLDNPTIQCRLGFHYCFRREFQTTLNNNLHVFRMKLIEKFCSLDTMITTAVYGCNWISDANAKPSNRILRQYSKLSQHQHIMCLRYTNAQFSVSIHLIALCADQAWSIMQEYFQMNILLKCWVWSSTDNFTICHAYLNYLITTGI